jgi:hypothetical protein
MRKLGYYGLKARILQMPELSASGICVSLGFAHQAQKRASSSLSSVSGLATLTYTQLQLVATVAICGVSRVS